MPGAVVPLVAAFGALGLTPWDQGIMASGLAVNARRYLDTGHTPRTRLQSETVLFYRDGISSTVSVHLAGREMFLRVNGKTDASTGVDMSTQLLLGHLPLLVHPAAKSALVIGMGGGVTAGAIARHPVQRIDLVELEPAVVEATRFFVGVNGDVLKEARVRTVIADGRNFLLTTGQRYDGIVS